MEQVFYHYYSGHAGWFWTTYRIEGLEVRDVTQDWRKAMD